ncbi:alpha/beta hydrolase [Amylibacter sp. SFDW26]|uniref:alpha/beta hydrolase n=1 Tax=Amylibacter sp. SFDW26 TaxID=2652722 RepID=UPI0012629370|nr:alpha/beta hydrolase [Amylibacter sp. SFDW26]KAB7613761.1 alpha/beta hydrolase [Amylibacter sp. SFDW26]
MMDTAPFHIHVAEGPINVFAYWIHTEDNVRLRVTYWPTDKVSKGSIFIFQGRTENNEKYGRTAEEIHKAGYNTFAIDWRGQGLSDRLTDDRMTGHILKYSDYQKDVAAMIDAASALDLPKPWYLIGHSLGACIGLRSITEGLLPVSACAFTAPLWDINLSLFQRYAAWSLAWTAQFLGKGHLYAPGTRGESYVLNTAFEDNRLTHDPGMYQYYINISKSLVDQQIGGPSMGWLFQTLKETRSLSKMSSPSIPCITFCGAEDSIVAAPAAQNRMARWPNGAFDLVQGAKHDVLYESPNIRESVIAKICDLFAAEN